MARVLAVGDIHIPAEHPGYLDWCISIYDAWECDTVVFIGDIFDWHAISFHAKELDAPTAEQEHAEAYERVQQWARCFSPAKVCIGNHDERVERLAAHAGVPPQFVKSYTETWDTPGWEWDHEHTIDGVLYTHGTGMSGQSPALRAATARMTSVVMGHCHSQAGVRWSAGPDRIVFGMDTGCGVNPKHPAMRYGRNLVKRPVLGCGVVIDGTPYHERMPLA